MEDINLNNITTDILSTPLFEKRQLEVSILRLDKIHPLISGNKWFKLRFHIDEAKKQGKKKILTFGGAWSNHILATAAACKLYNLFAIGIIRGEEAAALSPTLIQAKELGMQLVFTSREEYKQKMIPNVLNDEDCYIVSEGGFGARGAEGAASILAHCKKNEYNHICCAVGTGTMMAGLIISAVPGTKVTGISVLKNNTELQDQVTTLLPAKMENYEIIHEYHFGGYAKHKPELLAFMNSFYRQTSVPTDFVYTGKLCFAVNDLAEKNFFPPESRILVIHSGGLQGNQSLNKGTLIF